MVRMAGRAQLYLPAGYTENRPEDVDVDGPNFWARPLETRTRNARRYQDPVYKFAARVARNGARLVLDIGCGTGQNLMRHLGGVVERTIGVDQPSAIALAREEFPDHDWVAADLRADELWDGLTRLRPDVSICADVIEHVDDPLELLERLRSVIGQEGTLVLSTPDRERVEGQPPLGPPRNRHHVREWAFPEMSRLLRSAGFTIRSSRHVLPRHYPLTKTEAKILAWRVLHLKAVPGRRSCMVFELSAA